MYQRLDEQFLSGQLLAMLSRLSDLCGAIMSGAPIDPSFKYAICALISGFREHMCQLLEKSFQKAACMDLTIPVSLKVSGWWLGAFVNRDV